VIIALIIAAGYGFYIVIELNEGLASLGLISFVAAAQLLPGVIGLLFWARATRAGFLSGLIGGALVWFALLIWPLLQPDTRLLQHLPNNTDIWTLSTFCSLSFNGLLFVIGSLFSTPTRDEIIAARAAIEQSGFTLSGLSTPRSVLHFRYAMQQVLGTKVAAAELDSALLETGIDVDETRPPELRLLHEQLERNLTGLVGPTLARDILRYDRSMPDATTEKADDARLLELRLEASREQMRGMTKQLDDLRRYLRDVLQELPLGACSIAADGTIYLWNSAIQTLTGISGRQARDKRLDELPPPWNKLLGEFAESAENYQFRCQVSDAGRTVTVNLRKADVGTPAGSDDSLAGQVILMEDRSSIDSLEAELAHSERLASVGRLAAGVAHEIGNPLTGIASLAQNMHYDATQTSDSQLVRENAEDILLQVNRINGIVHSLLTFSHADSVTAASHEMVFLAESVNEALRLVRLAPATQELHFEVSVPPDARIVGDANQLMQVFVNLLNNACDASSTGATISVQGDFDAENILINISDQGSGIDPVSRARVFEPFFTTKPVGQGTGLGLSLVYSIISRHGGQVRIDENYNTGTRVVVSLPLASSTMQVSGSSV
jgi:signal transduction histidine kinase/chaperonin cofactor prefoldin